MSTDTVRHNLGYIYSISNREYIINNDVGDPYLNIEPDFQRGYESWNDKLKTRLIETMLIGRAMNPIWTVFNEEEDSDEVLDGMHRLTTALEFLSNNFKINGDYLSSLDKETYHSYSFKELSPDDKKKIRNYNFTFNKLDSSYKKDLNKLRDMYEILNRSSRTLNDFEFNKPLYNEFYDIITSNKDKINKLSFIKGKDERGNVEEQLIDIIVLTQALPKNWSSITTLKNNWIDKNLGNTTESISAYLNDNKDNIVKLLCEITNIVSIYKEYGLFSTDKRIYNTNYLAYKFIVARFLYHQQKNISAILKRHVKSLIEKFNKILFEEDIQLKLGFKSKNAVYQRKLIDIIDNIYDDEFENIKRLFSSEMKLKKLAEQNNICPMCKKDIKEGDKYEGDHITAWTLGGKTEYENLQVVHQRCHRTMKI